MLVGPAHPDGPLLHHGQLHLGAVLPLEHIDRLGHGKGAALDGDDGPLHFWGQHDLVEDGVGLLDRAQHVAADDLVPRLHHGGELPLLLPVQGGHLHAPGQVVASAHLPDDLQGALNAVVDIFDEAGTQLHGQGGAGGDHLRPGAQAGGLLIHLDGGRVPGHVQDLADKALLPHPDHVGHVGLLHPRGHHQRAGNFYDLSHRLLPSFCRTPAPKAGSRGNAPGFTPGVKEISSRAEQDTPQGALSRPCGAIHLARLRSTPLLAPPRLVHHPRRARVRGVSKAVSLGTAFVSRRTQSP